MTLHVNYSAGSIPLAPGHVGERVQGGQSFVLFKHSADRVRSTHIVEANLLCLKCTDLNVNLIQKLPYKNLQNNVWPNSWVPWLNQVVM